MRYILALFLPWLVFFTMGKPFQGFICLVLQLTILGWIPAVIWSFFVISDYNKRKETDRLIEAIKQNN